MHFDANLGQLLTRQVSQLQTRNRELSAEKQELLSQLIEQKTGFEEELISLRRDVAKLEFARLPEATLAPKASVEAVAQVSRLQAENDALRAQLRLADAVAEQNKRHETLITAQQHQINFLSAKVDAFDFLKADYTRLGEEFATKSRVAHSLAKKLATFTSPPPVDIELLNFQQKISDQLTLFTEALTKAFGWRIRQTTLGGFLFTRGDMEISVSNDFRVLAVKNAGDHVIPVGVALCDLLALMTLAHNTTPTPTPTL